MRSILFEIGPIPIRAYGFMLIIGFVLGLARAVRVAKKREINPERVMDAALIGLIAGIVGSRLVFMLLSMDEHSYTLSDIYRVWEGGLSFHGGLIFAIIAVAIYLRRVKIPFLQMADLLAPSAAIGYAFTRIGCFLNGCCYGHATDLPWAISFRDATLGGLITEPSHPAQLYAFAANIAIFALLTRVEKLKRAHGFTFFAYIGLYSIYRFLIEIVRKGVTADIAFAGITEAQILSIALLIVSAFFLWIKRASSSAKG